MIVPFFQIDAFTDSLFHGNPAGVCPLESWLPDETMQLIAAENNLAETAFIVQEGDKYRIRWFTPLVEVDLCGHATLASAFVLFHHLGFKGEEIIFNSRSGPLTVVRDGEFLTLDFPTDSLEKIVLPPDLEKSLNRLPAEVYQGATDYLLIYDSQEEVESLAPDFRLMKECLGRGVIASSPGRDTDFVSRFFAPQVGIDEDPVTGSAHTTLTPYWAEKLGKKEMTARQISARGGYLRCQHLGNRVKLSGQAVTYLSGKLHL